MVNKAFEKWFMEEQGKAYYSHYDFAKAAWEAATDRAIGFCEEEIDNCFGSRFSVVSAADIKKRIEDTSK